MIFSNDWFVNGICSLVLSQHFHFLKIPKTDVIYVLCTGVGVRIKINILMCSHWVVLLGYATTAHIGCVSGGEGPKMINQYFNVYALRRVRTAGYATAKEILCNPVYQSSKPNGMILLYIAWLGWVDPKYYFYQCVICITRKAPAMIKNLFKNSWIQMVIWITPTSSWYYSQAILKITSYSLTFWVMLPTDRQTNKQNQCQQNHNLFGGGNYYLNNFFVNRRHSSRVLCI